MTPTQTPITAIGNIPLSTWEQAGLIVLFMLFAIGFLGSMYGFTRAILKVLKDFIEASNKQWQAYIDKRELAFGERNGAVVDAIRSMTREFKLLREDFSDHDKRVDGAITRMDERTRSRGEAPAGGE